MDPTTTLETLAIAYGGKEVATKLLGPTAEYLGMGAKNWTEKAYKNLGRIFEIAGKRLGEQKLNEPGGVPPRVVKEVMNEGPFCEDEVVAEYFGGVLASSRSGVSRDDRGARFAAMVGRLSTYQIRGHFVFYTLFKTLFDGTTLTPAISKDRRKLSMFVPMEAFSHAMQLGAGENLQVIVSHVVAGLAAEELLDKTYKHGSAEHLTANRCKTDLPGIVVQPSTLGAELFLWAHGQGDIPAALLLRKEVNLESDVTIQVSSGVRAVEEDGPNLDAILAAREARSEPAARSTASL